MTMPQLLSYDHSGTGYHYNMSAILNIKCL